MFSCVTHRLGCRSVILPRLSGLYNTGTTLSCNLKQTILYTSFTQTKLLYRNILGLRYTVWPKTTWTSRQNQPRTSQTIPQQKTCRSIPPFTLGSQGNSLAHSESSPGCSFPSPRTSPKLRHPKTAARLLPWRPWAQLHQTFVTDHPIIFGGFDMVLWHPLTKLFITHFSIPNGPQWRLGKNENMSKCICYIVLPMMLANI